MPIKIEKGKFADVVEVWGLGPNAIEVVMAHTHRRFRITAAQNLYSGARPEAAYFAHYDELIEVEINGAPKRVWAAVSMPYADAGTIEACLQSALSWVNIKHRDERA